MLACASSSAERLVLTTPADHRKKWWPGPNVREAQGVAVDGRLLVFGGYGYACVPKYVISDYRETPDARPRRKRGGGCGGYEIMHNATWSLEMPVMSARGELNGGGWTAKEPMPIQHMGVPQQGNTHMGNAVDEATGDVYLVGGLALAPGNYGRRGSHSVNAALVYHSRRNEWSRLPDLPEELLGGGAALLEGRLHFVAGGVFHSGMYHGDSSKHWALSIGDEKPAWRPLASSSYPRNHMAMVAHAGQLYAFGGQLLNQEACKNQAVLEAYDPRTDSWRTLAPMPVGRGHITPSSLSTPHGIVVLGGTVDKPPWDPDRCRTPGVPAASGLHFDAWTGVWTEFLESPAGPSQVCGFFPLRYEEGAAPLNQSLNQSMLVCSLSDHVDFRIATWL